MSGSDSDTGDDAPGDGGVLGDYVGKILRCEGCYKSTETCLCKAERRSTMKLMGLGVAGGLGAALAERDVITSVSASERSEGTAFDIADPGDPDAVFPQSVCSGGPTESGVILWTRIAPDAYQEDLDLGIRVAEDPAFEEVVQEGSVSAEDIKPENDYAVRADVDGWLDSNGEYYYQFVYDGTYSRTGRCRTLPADGDDVSELSFGVVSCTNYPSGYFKALDYIADEGHDFLLHLGDFIYERPGGWYGNDAGRAVDYTDYIEGHDRSGGHAVSVGEYRAIYKEMKKESDPLRRALERHTMIATWDDHEIGNDRYWDYEADAPRIPSILNGDGDLRSGPRNSDAVNNDRPHVDLTANAIQAWMEHIPSRIDFDPDSFDPASDHLHEEFNMWRSFDMGGLVDLGLTDQRLFRTQPVCENFFDGLPCEGGITGTDPDWLGTNTMLGEDQLGWFKDEFIRGSDATWTVWMNEVLCMPIMVADSSFAIEVTHDGWDGYSRERADITSTINDSGVDNFIALTGDAHMSVAGKLKTSYALFESDDFLPDLLPSTVGFELMPPAVSSRPIWTLLDSRVESADGSSSTDYEDALVEGLIDWSTGAFGSNDHFDYLNLRRNGYGTLRVTDEAATFTAYRVSRTNTDADRSVLFTRRIENGANEMSEPPTAAFEADSVKIDPGGTVNFDASASEPGSDGPIESYEWEFDDGATDSGETVSHTFEEEGSYRVTLTVSETHGGFSSETVTDTAAVVIEVTDGNVPPIGDFSWTPSLPEPGEEVTFDGTPSVDPDGEGEDAIAEYRWDFGAGDTATGPDPTYTFEEAGTYEVVLTVTDVDGDTDTVSHDVEVGEDTAALSAQFTWTPELPETGQTVEFDAAFSKVADDAPPSRSIDSYAWEFGDGGTDDDEVSTHTYDEAGTYEVTLTVTDSAGNTDDTTHTVEVFASEVDGGIGSPDHRETNTGTLAADGSRDTDGDGEPDEVPTEQTYAYSPRVDNPERLQIVLDGPPRADFDVFVTLDGRTPTESDYDFRSRTTNADERLTIEGDSIDAASDVRVLVRAYDGEGDYSVQIREWNA